MCSINHDLKAIYIHVPKNGGLYVEQILKRYYGFELDYIIKQIIMDLYIRMKNFIFQKKDEVF